MDKYMIFLRSFYLKLQIKIKIIQQRFNSVFSRHLYFLINHLLSFKETIVHLLKIVKLWVLYGRHLCLYLFFL